MGGFGSGGWYRWSTRSVIEDGLVLNLHRCIRQGLIKPGCATSGGSLVWSTVPEGKKTATIGYSYNMLNDWQASLTLSYRVTPSGGEPVDIKDQIRLTFTEPHFGGKRWWFICPHTGRRAAKLYLPPGARHFRHRAAYRVAYRSQNEEPHERALSKAQKIRTKLGGSLSTYDLFPAKPKGMHWKTYYRLMETAYEAEEASNRWAMLRFGVIM